MNVEKLFPKSSQSNYSSSEPILVRDIVYELYDIICKDLSITGGKKGALKNKLKGHTLIKNYGMKSVTAAKKPRKIMSNPSVNLNLINDEELVILRLCAEIHQMSFADFCAPGRKQERVDARRQAMVVLKDNLNYTYTRIGMLFNRDHSSVIYSRDKHMELLDGDPSYKKRFNRLVNELLEQGVIAEA